MASNNGTALATLDHAPQQFGWDQLVQMGRVMAGSGMFPSVRNPEQAVTLLLLAQSEGLHPMRAAMEYHIIEGKPSLKADTMLARHQISGGKCNWLERTDTKVTAHFIGPLGEATITWDKDRATKAGLWGKANFQKHPCQMLAARCVSEGVRATNPAAIQGFYTPEEVQFFEDKPAAPKQQRPPKDNVRADLDYRDMPAAEVTVHAEDVPEGEAVWAKSGRPVGSVMDEPPAVHNTAVSAEAQARLDAQAQATAAGMLRCGVPIRVELSKGRCDTAGKKQRLAWLAVDTETGAKEPIVCWHQDTPVKATGCEHPEEYTGPVVVTLKRKKDKDTGTTFCEVDTILSVEQSPNFKQEVAANG